MNGASADMYHSPQIDVAQNISTAKDHIVLRFRVNLFKTEGEIDEQRTVVE